MEALTATRGDGGHPLGVISAPTCHLVAFELRKEDPKKNTQARVAALLGVKRQTVGDWFTPKDGRTNAGSGNGSNQRPDARVIVNPEQKPLIAERALAGESEAQIAADYKVSQRAISKIVKAEFKALAAKEARENAAAKRTTNCGVVHGDFRIEAATIADASVDLIFTDPPYDQAGIDVYGQIAQLAAAKLAPSGWLLAYSGKSHLPDVMAALSAVEGLVYGWTFCVLHTGGDTRFRKLNIRTGWKPIIGPSPCHLVTPSPCHPVTPSPCHPVTPSPRPLLARNPLYFMAARRMGRPSRRTDGSPAPPATPARQEAPGPPGRAGGFSPAALPQVGNFSRYSADLMSS